MLSHQGGWSISEAILTTGQATADNLPAGLAEIQYMLRVPTIAMAEQATVVLDRNADPAVPASAAAVSNATGSASRGPASPITSWREPYSRRLPKSALRNGTKTPRQLAARSSGMQSSTRPTSLLSTNANASSRPVNATPYPAWVMNALGGIPSTIDPMVARAAKTLPFRRCACWKTTPPAMAEFVQRTGGGVGGSDWIAPLCDYDPPVHFCWPEYVTTSRGRDWWIPTQP